jgi:hypothetical protein
VSRRRDNLSFQHHAEVASLPEPQRELWLHRAEAAGWSRNELRRQLAAARQRPRALPDAAASPRSVPLTPANSRRWLAAADTAGQDLVEWMTGTLDAAADAILTPPAQEPGRYGSSAQQAG